MLQYAIVFNEVTEFLVGSLFVLDPINVIIEKIIVFTELESRRNGRFDIEMRDSLYGINLYGFTINCCSNDAISRIK